MERCLVAPSLPWIHVELALTRHCPVWLIARSARARTAVGPWVAAAWPATARARGNPAKNKVKCICPFV